MAIAGGRERAPFAADPAQSLGRLYAEPPSRSRNPFRRDCDRIIHAAAFRRLKHKTQVFVSSEGDYYRTRLTHTLEVMQIARALARALGLDEDLAEALALAHDLGHPPFGHSGERALDACLADAGGFDHNAQSLRVVTRLERRYPTFDGLNLTFETLEGIVKHNGPLTDAAGAPTGRHRARGVAPVIAAYCAVHDLRLATFASAEAQVAAISDDIAYNAHDIDDGLRAGLFSLDDLAAVPLLGEILAGIVRAYPGLDAARTARELVRELIGRMIGDVVAEADRRIARLAPSSIDDIRRAPRPVIGFSAGMEKSEAAIKAFLFRRMYRHDRIMSIMGEAEGVVRDLFAHYSARPDDLPGDWGVVMSATEAGAGARHVADFIAGMTDRFALAEHARFFDSTPDLR